MGYPDYCADNMGDKSPKEVHKKDIQKHAKADAVVHEKLENAEAQHHPTSGHTATPWGEEEGVGRSH
jgi:hypothetical protein